MITRVISLLTLFLSVLGTSSCTVSAPACPEDLRSTNESQPLSAGCFAVYDKGLLLVQGLNHKVSVPGGSSMDKESGRCTAFRETWEETGLRLKPKELLDIFDTGFHLYRCQHNSASGTISPPPRMEVRNAFYLKAEDFENFEWRFPEQKQLLRQMLRDSAE